ncbi:MAG: hypothetical protein JRF40_05960 [Deltaproteobacteria bacterium]|nr:hypothetical protein [Deltaproteobacteria bacterium]MBW2219020.1 hypothetical protein [Deltaproteobacteria bacterium]
MKLIRSLNEKFESQSAIYWGNMSRFTNLLTILNLSLFFISELVITHGYYYTYYSLLCLGIVHLGLLIPFGLFNRLWYYCIVMVFEAVAIHFFVISVWYWIITNKT